MPYVIFKFAVGDTAYAEFGIPHVICAEPVYFPYTVESFYRIDANNYYRLSDGRTLGDYELLTEKEYSEYIALSKLEEIECLNKALEDL